MTMMINYNYKYTQELIEDCQSNWLRLPKRLKKLKELLRPLVLYVQKSESLFQSVGTDWGRSFKRSARAC